MILVGELALWVALLMAAWGAIVSFAGGYSRRVELVVSGERALHATVVCVVLATTGLLIALVSSDFSFEYAARVSSANLPVPYKITALWAGEAGSLLLWALILSMYAVMAATSSRTRHQPILPYVAGTLSAITFFLLVVLCLVANPYDRLAITPPDGAGMHPSLQTPGMALHPPLLSLGYVATTIPFALAMAALLARNVNGGFFRDVRRWAFVSWFFLTIGITIGMWWAYTEVGWGGPWAWDPVQNASLLPWLTNTALLHASVAREKRGVLQKWIILLALSGFLVVLLGAFTTRSGIAPSVHAFPRSEAGYWFGALLVISVAGTASVLPGRLADLGTPARLESAVSRDGGVVLNTTLLVTIAAWLAVGLLLPVLNENVNGDQPIGPAFFTVVIVPLGLALLAFIGVGSLAGTGHVSGAALRRKALLPAAAGLLVIVGLAALGTRGLAALLTFGVAAFALTSIARGFAGEASARHGATVIHVGLVIVFVALAGFSLGTEHDVSLGPGEPVTLLDPFGHSWTFTSQGISAFEERNRQVVAVGLQTAREGKPRGLIRSERRQYVDSRGVPIFEPQPEPGISHSLLQDTYVVLTSETGERASVRIAFNPLVMWLWIGGLTMVLGGVVVMWPARP